MDEQLKNTGEDSDSQHPVEQKHDAKATTTADISAGGMIVVFIILFFLLGLAVGVIGHLVFPWMIGNLQHAIATRSFVWNANQAAQDSTVVMRAMIWVVERNVFSVALWSALVLGIPLGLLGCITGAKKK